MERGTTAKTRAAKNAQIVRDAEEEAERQEAAAQKGCPLRTTPPLRPGQMNRGGPRHSACAVLCCQPKRNLSCSSTCTSLAVLIFSCCLEVRLPVDGVIFGTCSRKYSLQNKLHACIT